MMGSNVATFCPRPQSYYDYPIEYRIEEFGVLVPPKVPFSRKFIGIRRSLYLDFKGT